MHVCLAIFLGLFFSSALVRMAEWLQFENFTYDSNVSECSFILDLFEARNQFRTWSLFSSIPMHCVRHKFEQFSMFCHCLDKLQRVKLRVELNFGIDRNRFFLRCQRRLLQIVVRLRFLARIGQSLPLDR